MNKQKKDLDRPGCANCSSPRSPQGGPLRACTRCALVSYCSRNCQKQHWVEGQHRDFCVTPQERRVRASAAQEVNADYGDTPNCPICLQSLVLQDPSTPILTLPCSHSVHTTCADKLRSLSDHLLCPVCRSSLPSQSSESSAVEASRPRSNQKCANCGAAEGESGIALRDCSRCKLVAYCGRDCQVKHWKLGGHKDQCGKSSDARDSTADNDRDGLALMSAASHGELEAVKAAISAGVPVNFQAKCGTTALMFAAHYGHVGVIRALLRAGADVNVQRKAQNNATTMAGKTALMLAVMAEHFQVIKALIEAGAIIDDCRGENHQPPLVYASGVCSTKVANLLLESGADVNIQDFGGATAVLTAAYTGSPNMVHLLVKAGANVNLADQDMNFPLAFAASHCNVEPLRILIQAGANLNSTNKEGWTALIRAANFGHVHVVNALLKAGARVNMVSNEGWDALAVAARQGDVSIAKALVKAGADANRQLKRDAGVGALSVATEQGHAGVVQVLIDAGIDLSVIVQGGSTLGEKARLYAAMKGHVKVVAVLDKALQ